MGAFSILTRSFAFFKKHDAENSGFPSLLEKQKE